MSYSIDLSGRVALITGASSGLGAQFARVLSQAGAAVVLGGRRSDRLKELRAEIEGQGGDAHVVELDVTDLDSIKSAVAHAETEVGVLDILINNSGVSATQKILDVTPDDQTVYYFAGIDGARFKRPVEPGDQLILQAQIDRMKAGIFKFKAQALVGTELAVEAELMCTMKKIA